MEEEGDESSDKPNGNLLFRASIFPPATRFYVNTNTLDHKFKFLGDVWRYKKSLGDEVIGT